MEADEKTPSIVYDDTGVRRLWDKDATLWSDHHQKIHSIKRRLGWLDSPRWLRSQLYDLKKRISAIQDYKWKGIVLIGMGGSSLAATVLYRMAIIEKGRPVDPYFEVLDTIHPNGIRNISARENLSETLFIISSKSGSTIEVNALWLYIDELLRCRGSNHGERGKNFVAITDPGSPLEALADDNGFLDCFLNPSDIGGRFSALTYYGMVPAALLGFDVQGLLESAEHQVSISKMTMVEKNSPFKLGWEIGSQALNGKNKLTLIFSKENEPLGVWIEQLLAESTGKDGRGVVPIINEPVLNSVEYGSDRFFVTVGAINSHHVMNIQHELISAGFSVFQLDMDGLNDIGGEFFRWQFATAVAGSVLGINPFDEPQVQRAKDATISFLDGKSHLKTQTMERCIRKNSMILIGNDFDYGKFLNASEEINRLFKHVNLGNYVAILSWLEETDEIYEKLVAISNRVRESLGVPVTLGFGPRYLHSTGQLHKGDSNTGIFLQIYSEPENNQTIPTWKHGFSDLHKAQADADLVVLSDLGRRLLRIDVQTSVISGLTKLDEVINYALSH
ncbi:MAG: hypothetical protein CL402_10650 [Acidiferrobacteraceae bacterium]|nr:hypothetical protein [Acidiferrobacteraceae bacterium]|tara:strand:+ start:2983 stop:4665 length:1683 start_codon:yes stop_codon:yes gene_type:complete